MRAVAFALLVIAVCATGSAAETTGAEVAFLNGSKLTVVDLGDGSRHVAATNMPKGAVRWSGDGRLLSVGGRIVGGPTLPTRSAIDWAPTGETAGYITTRGGFGTWTPTGGRRLIVPDGWGVRSAAWNADGSLALGRAVCRGACGWPTQASIWVWRNGSLRRMIGPLAGDRFPIPFAWSSGRVIWWDYPDSASIAADGVDLYANRRKLAKALMYADYVAVCGDRLAIAAGSDRYAMHGKRIVVDGRDVSRDPSRSWVSPSCSTDGSTLVAAASKNAVPMRIGREHRAIWRLLPTRTQLTHPPAGTTDEYPRVLPDGTILFLRTRAGSTTLALYGVGTIELLGHGRLTALGTVSRANNYYGHYDWPDVVAVRP